MSLAARLCCLLALALGACGTGARWPTWLGGHRRHVVLIVVDTLRADAMARARTPRLDEFARRGDEAAVAWTAATWTAPSVISLFTGASVREHGWDFPFPAYMDDRTASYPEVPDLPVLAEVLHDAGFDTAGFVGNPLLRRELGYSRGFDRWRFVRDRAAARRVRVEVARWQPGERHFLYVHLFGAHQPLRPSAAALHRWGVDTALLSPRGGFPARRAREGGPEAVEQYRRAYYATVEDLDAVVGDILDALAPVAGDAAILVTSDHGELLGEHGLVGHNHWVWAPLTRVPLLSNDGVELPRRVSLAAVPDLLTRAAGVEHDWPTRADDPGPLVARREGKVAMTEDGRTEAIWDADALPGGFGAFDLQADPGEAHPLDGARPEWEARRAAWEARVPARHLAPVDGGIGDDLRDALTQLGYMDGD